mmetsp:Transcript_22169/g.54874  ORF Transcript_22169/g.54874 Transcript_22169/m.54874 type:complete len:246 (-) Transcript_22169:511-1248(-)
MQTAPQIMTQQIPTPLQQTPQSEAHSQPYAQQLSYAMPQQQQHPLAPVPAPAQLAQPPAPHIQQQQHALAPVPAPSHATQLPPQPQAPLIQQQQQQPYQMNLPSHPQHKQEQYDAPAPQLDADTEFERRQLQSYETTVPPPNLPPPQSHAAPQQMVPIPAPHALQAQQQQQQQQHPVHRNLCAPDPIVFEAKGQQKTPGGFQKGHGRPRGHSPPANPRLHPGTRRQNAHASQRVRGRRQDLLSGL